MASIRLPWKFRRLVVWVAALADWARACVPPGRRGNDLLERLVLEPHVQLEVPLGDLVIDVSQMHRTQVIAQLNFQIVFRGLQRSSGPLIVDEGHPESIPLVHSHQRQLGIQGQTKLLGLAEKAKWVGAGYRRVNVVGEREIEDAFEGIGRDPDLSPGIVKLSTIVHQVHAIFERDPDGGLEQVFQAFFVLGVELLGACFDSCGRAREPIGLRRRYLRARESWR